MFWWKPEQAHSSAIGQNKETFLSVILSTQKICFGWEIRKLYVNRALLSGALTLMTICWPDIFSRWFKDLLQTLHVGQWPTFHGGSMTLSYDWGHFSNSDLSDLRIVGTCDIHVYRMGHQIVIHTIGWLKLVINLCHHASLKPLFWPGHVGNVSKNVWV